MRFGRLTVIGDEPNGDPMRLSASGESESAALNALREQLVAIIKPTESIEIVI